MEPFLTDDPDTILSAALLDDIGWTILTNAPSLPQANISATAQITGSANPGTNSTGLLITAINHTGVAVPNATFELIIPTNVSITNATPSAGSCSLTTDLLRCNLGTLAANSSNTTVTMDAAVSDGFEKELLFNLSGPLFDTTMSNNQASVVINPPAVVPDISFANAQATEGDPGDNNAIIFTVSLSTATTVAVSVDYASSENSATSGVDYTIVNDTLTIPAGSNSGLIEVPIIEDDEPELDETLTLTLSNPRSWMRISVRMIRPMKPLIVTRYRVWSLS